MTEPVNEPIVYQGMDLELTGRIRHHARKNCSTDLYCPFHDPSMHVMADWPMSLRETGLIERICPHGVGHPDPDSAAFIATGYGHPVQTWLTHGCDGCCTAVTRFCAVCGAEVQVSQVTVTESANETYFCGNHREG